MPIGKRMRYYVACIKDIITKIRLKERKKLTRGFLLLIVGACVGNVVGHVSERKRAKKELEEVTAQVRTEEQAKTYAVKQELEELQKPPEEVVYPWYLTLVNKDHPMKEDYVPELTEIEKNYSVDTRIADALKKMLSDAEKEGLNIIICSAYRSVLRQEQVFNASMEERIRQGMSNWEAYQETSKSVAVPGTSEHGLGLAVDLISSQYDELDEKQAETKEAKWLAEHCHEYGFILRYPPEKTAITGIIYEPWHYRYVGEEDAKKIMEQDLTLEEYLQQMRE